MRMMGGVVGSLALGMLAACDPYAEEFDEIHRNQREIFYRLGSLDKAIQQMGSKPAAPSEVPPRKEYPDKVYAIPVGASPVRGPKDAPVTIVEFSDFQCPPCARSRDLVRQVLAAYPKDVHLVYKQYPLTNMHKDALAAAKAAVAAGKQGKFWEMHDVLYENQEYLGGDKLVEYARRIGLDVQRWQRDFDSSEVYDQVVQETRDAKAADVDATPTFFVNGKRVGPDRTFDAFKTAIDGALKEKPASAKPAKKG